jgi:ABC-2 type transport system ATP-binding protein
VRVDGHDIVTDYRAARSLIGLVPQELTTDAFESVWGTVSFSRGLFGKRANPQYIEKVLRDLSLWERKDSKIITLSGGMKRRLLIAKALSHEPEILFLDEPTAGVDVNLRRDMWQLVRSLQATGVTIILTTHYIDEAEEMAERIGVISKGELILVEDKAELMRKLGRKQLVLHLQTPLIASRRRWPRYQLELSRDGSELVYTYDARGEGSGILALLEDLKRCRHRLPGPADDAEFARRDLRQPREGRTMNLPAMRAIYLFEMARTRRTLLQSIVSPVISTSLYFVVFGAAIGSRIDEIDGVSYGAFIVPGLIMLSTADAERRQRVVRHLLSALHGNDLRAALGAGLVSRDRGQLCRRCGDQVDLPRPDHPRDCRRCSCRSHRSILLDAALPAC